MKIALLAAALIIYMPCMGQHHMKPMDDAAHMNSGDDTSSMVKNMPADMPMPGMSNAFSRNLPMKRNGSGTAWSPDAAPMYGIMKHTGDWMFMFHGNLFPRYNWQDIANKGSRGGSMADAPDMLMLMGQRNNGRRGLFHFNLMLSTDALITGERGYPLLLQTGESANGQPLVDRQHPHDLFSELSVSYAYTLSHKSDAFIYAGYPGEPALGPATFMHRISGQFMPDAPISHHWTDATHITFGVATLGLRYGKFKLEGSLFTGREPDENRYNFDKPLLDSRSFRISCNPGPNWALQVSHGFITSPEALRPSEDLIRNTASATYARQLTKGGFFAATALWGQNISGPDVARLRHLDNVSNAALLEATLKMKKLALYSRLDWVQKSVEELDLGPLYGAEHSTFPVSAFRLGAAYDLLCINPFIIAGGAQVALYTTDEALQPLYGQRPMGAEVYLHIYPKRMQ